MTQKQLPYQYDIELHDQILKLFHKMELPLHDNHFGNKVYTNYQRVALIILFMRSRKALRDFAAELVESRWPKWLGLKDLPNFSTISRWIKKWSLSWVRDLLFATAPQKQPSLMAVDATGFDSWQRSRHYERRIGAAPMPYAKADILVDIKSRLIYDFTLRMKPRHDVLGAKTMFLRTSIKDALILADKGYDSEPLHQIALKTGNLMYAPVRKSPRNKPKGANRRRCAERHTEYPQRNIIEAINFSLKSRFRALRCKLHFMKKREFGWQLITYNLERLLQGACSLLEMIMRIIICNRADIDQYLRRQL